MKMQKKNVRDVLFWLFWTALVLGNPRFLPAQEALDITSLVASGEAVLTTSPYDIGAPLNIFDGDTETLLRSASVNPLLVTLEFSQPQPVSAFRVWFLAGDNSWRVESARNLADLENATGTYRLLVPWRTDHQAVWNEAPAAESDTVSVLRLSLHRLTGDDYVHLNEWEILAPAGWFRISDIAYLPTGQEIRITWGSGSGRWYRVETSPDLDTWTPGEFIKASGAFTSWLDQLPVLPVRKFYRVREVAPEDRPHITRRVLVLNYDPILEAHDGLRLHAFLGWNDPAQLTQEYLDDLALASHDYVEWEIVEFRDLDEWPLKADGFRYTDETYLECYFDSQNHPWHQPDGVDYENVIATQGLDELVQEGAVDEVIMWGAPYFGYWESHMVGATAYWCNSGPLIHPGVPLYVIMGLNYERGVAEALHSFGHRAESIMTHVYGSWSSDGTINHLWDRFTRVYSLHGSVPAGCGNIHFPPNGTADYDYSNPTPVLSEADDWLNFPQFQGTTDQVDCESWGGPDYQRNYLLWWYERLPHITGGRYSDGKLLNWWGYLLDMNEYPESR